jgi:Sulfotransferase family
MTSATAGAAGPPFFIVGAARSGTTLLRFMLDRHPDVAIPGESHFIAPMWARRRRYGRDDRIEDREAWLRDLLTLGTFRRWGLPVEAVRHELDPIDAPTFAQAIEAVFVACARSGGKTRWGDKTPDNVEHISLLARIFPKARFVHLVRDGRDVALSTIALRRLHRRAATAAYFWARAFRQGRGAASSLGPARYLEVRYETVLDDPEGEIRRLCRFLDLPFDPVMLEHDQHARDRLPERFRRLHPGVALPPTKGLRDWRRDMDRREVEEFEAIAGQDLLAAGYELSGRRIGQSARVRAWSRLISFAVAYVFRRMRSRREL